MSSIQCQGHHEIITQEILILIGCLNFKFIIFLFHSSFKADFTIRRKYCFFVSIKKGIAETVKQTVKCSNAECYSIKCVFLSK